MIENCIYSFTKKIQQYPKSLTGIGNRQTLNEIKIFTFSEIKKN